MLRGKSENAKREIRKRLTENQKLTDEKSENARLKMRI